LYTFGVAGIKYAAHRGVDLLAIDHRGGYPQVFDAAVGAGTDIDLIDGLTRSHEAFSREEGMTDAIVADVEEVLNPVAASPVAQNLSLGCGFRVLGRRHVIDDRLYPCRIVDLVPASANPIVDGDRRGDLMAEDAVQAQDANVCRRLVNEVGRKDFFSDCFSHVCPKW
jgi:hypothetical protein